MSKNPEPLDGLIDTAGLMAELGVTRHVAETMMDQLPMVRLGRRKYVKRSEVRKLLDRSTRPGLQ